MGDEPRGSVSRPSAGCRRLESVCDASHAQPTSDHSSKKRLNYLISPSDNYGRHTQWPTNRSSGGDGDDDQEFPRSFFVARFGTGIESPTPPPKLHAMPSIIHPSTHEAHTKRLKIMSLFAYALSRSLCNDAVTE